MCDGKGEDCQMFVKWYAYKKKYRMYCKAHGFRDQEYLTPKEAAYFKYYHPEMISHDCGPAPGEYVSKAGQSTRLGHIIKKG